jgi:hypothetical protein
MFELALHTIGLPLFDQQSTTLLVAIRAPSLRVTSLTN